MSGKFQHWHTRDFANLAAFVRPHLSLIMQFLALARSWLGLSISFAQNSSYFLLNTEKLAQFPFMVVSIFSLAACIRSTTSSLDISAILAILSINSPMARDSFRLGSIQTSLSDGDSDKAQLILVLS